MTKIAYCIDSLWNAAGMERVLTLKANQFCSIYNITFIIRDQNGKKPYYTLSNQIKLIDMKAKTPLEYKRGLATLLQKELFDIVISTGGWEFYFLYKINDPSKKIFEFHFSFYISKVWFNTANRGLSAKIKAYIQTVRRAIIARHYDQVVVLTTADANRWKWFCKNVVVIPNPLTISTNKISNCETKQAIAVGRLNREKGFDYLIEAWNLVHCQYPDWILKIYGEGDMRPLLQSQINRYGLQQSVFLKGNVSNIIDKYLKSSIFILSSRTEGFGLVVTEAEACGLPIVAFDLPEIHDIIKDKKNGYLVKEKANVEHLAQTVCKLICNKNLRKEFGANSIDIAKQFEIEIVLEAWKNLFKRLTNFP